MKPHGNVHNAKWVKRYYLVLWTFLTDKDIFVTILLTIIITKQHKRHFELIKIKFLL